MDNDELENQNVPTAIVTRLHFGLLQEDVIEKFAVFEINQASEVTDPRLGYPNLSNECTTCGGKGAKHCEGHYGVIKFPCTILHPYFISEIVKLLNKVCPACKSVRKDSKAKAAAARLKRQRHDCKYCGSHKTGWYPPMKFKVSSHDIFKRTTIMVEANETVPKKYHNKILKLPDDYWSFIPDTGEEQEVSAKANRKVLTYAQVHELLKNFDMDTVKHHLSKVDSLFLGSALVTPNNHRITEVTHSFSDNQTMMFDERTRAYKKLVDFKGKSAELGSRFHECLKLSKLSSEKTSVSGVSGSKYMKEIILGKKTDFSFRMVVVGDPKIKLSEIGIPCRIAERLQVSERITSWNWKRLSVYCQLKIFEKGEIYVRRNDTLVQIRNLKDCRAGDSLYRPLTDGDTLLINRPPSIHQHSLIALTAKIQPMNPVLSINPLICSPFRGDFDGDCLHGYIPQSVKSRVELEELVALDKQIIDGQSGKSLLSLSQDSLTAAYLVLDDDVLLTRAQMQQLTMFNPQRLRDPAICKTSSEKTGKWTGMQLFSTLLPKDLCCSFEKDSVEIVGGELVCSSGTYSWLRDSHDNLYSQLIKHGKNSTLKFLYDAQDVLSEWLLTRGLSVSLADMYLASDSSTRQNLIEEVRCGLLEADQTCHFGQLMVEGNKDLLSGHCHKSGEELVQEAEAASIERQKSAALCQASVSSFKKVFSDIQNLAYHYATKDNSILAMVKSGSKGNMQKLVQHSMCLGLQNSMVPLSYRFPYHLTCDAWNNQKRNSDLSESYIPFAVIETPYLTGLNPAESFVHSVTSRQSSFSDNADLPGTLTRKLMFLLRDYCLAYDGTVRNSYGNHIAQFTYNVDVSSKDGNHVPAGEPVGLLAGCAISEAAYSALDQPVSLLETSPLLNIKKVLECGSSRSGGDQTVSLFFSKNVGRHRHGFEYGAFEVKSHLEYLQFSDIVTSVQVNFEPPARGMSSYNSWVCHFHARKELIKTRRLNVRSIIEALQNSCILLQVDSEFYLPNLLIIATCKCAALKSENSSDELFCFSATFEGSKTSSLGFDAIRDVVIPLLLNTNIKGLPEVKKVDILWKDGPRLPRFSREVSGELYLKVVMSGDSGRKKFWNTLLDHCLPIMDLIDWSRSQPDNVHAIYAAYGIDSAWGYFVKSLNSAVSETGKAILPKHLPLVANSLSNAGEFVGLSASGLGKQRAAMEVSTPFVQACFSGPADCFIKAAKHDAVDNLEGSIDALAWGRTPPIGTGVQFDIIFSTPGLQVVKPIDVYSVLGGVDANHKQDVDDNVLPALSVPTKEFRAKFSFSDVVRLYDYWKHILHSTPIDNVLSHGDREAVLMALRFHPSKNEKFGCGVKDIKVARHPVHKARCFFVVRSDDTVEDFSYRKCILGALQIIHPKGIRLFKSKWQKATVE